jgi:hypothetical protein
MAYSLRDFFGTSALQFSATSSVSNTTRSYTSISQAIQEVIDARVYAGIHFRIADEHGALIGKQVARFRERHWFHAVRSW